MFMRGGESEEDEIVGVGAKNTYLNRPGATCGCRCERSLLGRFIRERLGLVAPKTSLSGRFIRERLGLVAPKTSLPAYFLRSEMPQTRATSWCRCDNVALDRSEPERLRAVALGGRSKSVFEHPNVKNTSDLGRSLC
ncbi:hypothetical protein F2Q69_00049955 [Brassica cretica]|uniref:Uncharacterized protein n=1 Tax=Brassica cretica TaxID=69181 RepID=A0A8S9Q1C4_BRACR|nr:hypothetical protein F2Q69_00049955 [Brassica cretica]